MLYIKTKQMISPYLLERNYMAERTQDDHKREYTYRLTDSNGKITDDSKEQSLDELVDSLITAGKDDPEAVALSAEKASEKIYVLSIYESVYGKRAGYSREVMWADNEALIRKLLKQRYNLEEFELIKKPGQIYETF